MPRIKLVVFDADGVLIRERSSWGYLHSRYGVSKYAKQYTQMYLEGKINYYEWMYLDTSLWIEASGGHLARHDIENMLDSVGIDEGMVRVARRLKEKGVTTAILSGGINLLVDRLSSIIGAEYRLANILVFDHENNLVPGGIPIVPPGSKGYWMKLLRERVNAIRDESVFIGDSVWDKEGFREAGLSILYNGGSIKCSSACVSAEKAEEVYDIIFRYSKDEIRCD